MGSAGGRCGRLFPATVTAMVAAMDATLATPRRPLAALISLWGMIGVVLLIGSALWRLTPWAVEPIVAGTLGVGHWVLMVAWVVFNAYAEGYRGFQKKFSPRTAARAIYLGTHPSPVRVVLAPLFCMGFFGATRRVMITAWVVLVVVLGLVAVVRSLAQPWRGIVDAGVVVGLGWGLVTLVGFFVKGLAEGELPVDPQVMPVAGREGEG